MSKPVTDQRIADILDQAQRWARTFRPEFVAGAIDAEKVALAEEVRVCRGLAVSDTSDADRDLIAEARRNFNQIDGPAFRDLYDRLTQRFTAVLDELDETRRHLEIARGQADRWGEQLTTEQTNSSVERAKLKEERDRAVREVFRAVEQRDAAKRLLSEIGAIVGYDGPLDETLVVKIRTLAKLALASDYEINGSH